jgi:hypothetical protein
MTPVFGPPALSVDRRPAPLKQGIEGIEGIEIIYYFTVYYI